MNNYLKPIFLTSLLALPLAGTASARHYGDCSDLIERRQQIREELRTNREQLRTAINNNNWDRAREERREIARNLQQLSDANYELAWYDANPNDYHYVTLEDGDTYYYVTVPDDDTYYYRRTIITTPGYSFSNIPGYRRVYDSEMDRYYYIRMR